MQCYASLAKGMSMQRIGKLSLVISLFALVGLQAATVRMSIKDQEGQLVRRVALGTPFTLDVIVDSQERVGAQPKLQISDTLTVVNSSVATSFSVVNQKRSHQKKFCYTLRPNALGVVPIGPVSVEVQGQTVMADQVSLEIVESVTPVAGVAKQFVRFDCDKKELYMHERVPVKLQFFTRKSGITLESVEWPQMDGLVFDFRAQPRVDKVEVSGAVYNVVTYDGTVYATKASEFVVPAIACSYKQPVSGRNWGMFNSFLGGGSQRKRIYSNALRLITQPLPSGLTEPILVGRACAVKAVVDKSEITQGDACLYKLIIQGEANFATFTPQALKLPDGLTSYPSASGELHTPPGYCYELVVQGTKPGDFIIPVQKFTFLNTQTDKAQDCFTQKIEIKVLPGVIVPHGDAGDSVDSNAKVQGVESVDDARTGMPGFITNVSWFGCERKSMGLRTIVWLLLCILLGCMAWFWLMLRRRFEREHPLLAAQAKAYRVARRAMVHARSEQKYGNLHGLFVTFLGQRWMLEGGLVTDAVIHQRLSSVLDEQGYADWQSFFATIKATSFAQTKDLAREEIQIAMQWLERLKDV
jgi:hypothetical protein